MKKLYTARTTAEGGRNGKVTSEDGALDIEVRPPKSLGGPDGKNLNPEILFAGGYAACFGSALSGIIDQKKADVKNTIITTEVNLIKSNEKGYTLAVAIEAEFEGVSQNEAEALTTAAHKVCPYSNATRGNIDVDLIVRTKN